jgi:hypothetical protein
LASVHAASTLTINFETGCSELISKSQPHKLRFAVMRSLGEASGSFGTHAPATPLDIGEMGP